MTSNITLENCISIANTGLDAIKRAPIVDVDTGVKCIRIQDVSQSKDYDNWGFTEVTPPNFAKFQLKKGDILIARTGGSVGVNRYITEDLQAVYNNGLIRIRVDTEKYYPKFVYYLLRTESFKQHINAIAFSTAAQPNMKIRDFLRFEFFDLSLKQQIYIADMLSWIDDKIELNRQTNQTLEQIAQSIFKSWFVDFEPVKAKIQAKQNDQDPELAVMCVISGKTEEQLKCLGEATLQQLKTTATLFPDALVESELGEVPEGWKASTLGENFNVVMGQSPKGDTYNEEGEGMLFFQGRRDFGFRFPTPRVYTTDPKRIAQAGDTLISVRAPVGDRNMAAVECCLGRGVACIRHKSGSRSFTYAFIGHIENKLSDSGSDGTIFSSINKNELNSVGFVSPGEKLISYYEGVVYSIDQRVDVVSREINTQENLRDSLLPKLLSGEISIDKTRGTVEAVA